uniref:Uncharacterized protein n=1 Tax=Physcomitrium patens TaxID=3218 RepID=A0A7I4DBC2_PHYPA
MADCKSVGEWTVRQSWARRETFKRNRRGS